MNKRKGTITHDGKSQGNKIITPATEGDGYAIAIKKTFVMEATNHNYVTIAVTGPDGKEKLLCLPIKSVLSQLLKDCKTS